MVSCQLQLLFFGKLFPIYVSESQDYVKNFDINMRYVYWNVGGLGIDQ